MGRASMRQLVVEGTTLYPSSSSTEDGMETGPLARYEERPLLEQPLQADGLWDEQRR